MYTNLNSEIKKKIFKCVNINQHYLIDCNLIKCIILGRHVFPESFLVHEALPITIVVDTRDGDCLSSFAYMADVNEYKLWVYSYADDESWRITNNYFFPYPFHGEFHVNDENFELMDGIFGLALGIYEKPISGV